MLCGLNIGRVLSDANKWTVRGRGATTAQGSIFNIHPDLGSESEL
jgi:hypothetical protein